MRDPYRDYVVDPLFVGVRGVDVANLLQVTLGVPQLVDSLHRVFAEHTTFLRGELVCENGSVLGKPRGRYLHRQTSN